MTTDLVPQGFADELCGFEFPLILRDEETNIVLLVNGALSGLLQLSADRIVGRSVTDFVQPAYEATAAAEALRSGAVDDLRARRRITRSDGSPVEVQVWTKTVLLTGRRCALTLLVTADDLPRLERDPVRPWRELAPIAVGTLDRSGCIASVSSEVSAVLGGSPGEWIGKRIDSILSEPDAKVVREIVSSGSLTTTNRDVELRPRNGSRAHASLILARDRRLREGAIAFALIRSLSDIKRGSDSRVHELEQRLRRIGAEVRAARVLDVLVEDQMDLGTNFPQLAELSTRQWEILSRLRRGDRVSNIARELYLSPSTIRNHLSAIFGKFGVHSQAELLAVLNK
jgi:DNA-binding CsgD family transcriptional regulator/PAS domain-containing protein